ncbi:MAG: chloramphenicol acetyltransferase [Oscillospiraceae bacterium]|nr:chloramphenicol acetyltransferase [Oscillospiraceae bacterium]
MKIIDLETYPRRSHYEYFKSLAYPYVGMTANVDVTGLLAAAKRRGKSSFLACLYAACQAVNAVSALRQRIRDGQIVEFARCDAGHTVAKEDGTFVNCRTDSSLDFDSFLTLGEIAQQQAKAQTGFLNDKEDETGLIFVSCVPWVSFTSVIQPTPIPADTNPRIIFGKYFTQDGRTMMPLAIQCNHALVDGLHIAQFYAKFQEFSDTIK